MAESSRYLSDGQELARPSHWLMAWCMGARHGITDTQLWYFRSTQSINTEHITNVYTDTSKTIRWLLTFARKRTSLSRPHDILFYFMNQNDGNLKKRSWAFAPSFIWCSPSRPLDNIRVMVIVWRLRWNIFRTGLCWIVWHSVHSLQHTYVISSYRSNRLGLSHWDPCTVRRGGCLELYYCNMVEWFWWNSSLIFDDQHGFLQCFDTVGLVIWPVKIIPEMTYYVSSRTLNPTHSLIWCTDALVSMYTVTDAIAVIYI